MGRLFNKVIIITGAGAGFGRGITFKLVQEGAWVLAVDKNESALSETISLLSSFATASTSNTAIGRCVPLAGDVTSPESWKSILQTTLNNYGRLDVLVNCAGVVHIASPSHLVQPEDFDAVMNVNVRPLYLSTTVMVPYWIERGQGGLVINMSSISEPRPRPNLVWYAASKGAVTVATKGLAAEYAKQQIRFNCIRPSVGETAMLARVLGGEETAEGRARILGTVPLGRVCMPEDVANVVVFLASDEANYMTGAAIDIDGGRGVS